MCYTFVRESFIFPAISPLFPETPVTVLAHMPKLFPPSISFRMSVITLYIYVLLNFKETHGGTKKQGLTAVRNQALKDCATKRPLSILWCASLCNMSITKSFIITMALVEIVFKHLMRTNCGC